MTNPSHPTSESTRLFIQNTGIRRTFSRLAVSVTTLRNGLKELMAFSFPDSLDVEKMDEEASEFRCSVLETRQIILTFLGLFDLPHDSKEDLSSELNVREARLVFQKLRSGLSGVRNAIKTLLDEKDDDAIRRHVASSEHARYLLNRLYSIVPHLSQLDGFSAEKLASLAARQKKCLQHKSPKAPSLPPTTPLLKTAKPSASPAKKTPKEKRTVYDFSPFMEQKKESFQEPVRYEIAHEIAMHMEDGEKGFTFNELAALFQEFDNLPTEVLERQLIRLSDELKGVGIQLKGNFKKDGKQLIRLVWLPL